MSSTTCAAGGSAKLSHEVFILEADNAIEARELFERLFNRDPDNVTCDTCGEDYAVSAADSLETLGHGVSYDRMLVLTGADIAERLRALVARGDP